MVDEEEEVFDFGRLRKRLREEYTFVNQQKRLLEKEYGNIVSTGDSLSRSLWINGHQWRNLLRLKGGVKFSSECTYTANLLDSISFVDGYQRVGFKEVKYGNFLRELKDNIALFKSILIVADDLHLDTSAFVRTMLVSLYGSCLFPGDEKSVLLIAKSLIEYHLVFSNTPHAILAVGRNSFSNVLEVLLQTSYQARAFLVSACKEVVLDILLDGSMFWTLEEKELLTVMDVSEVRHKFGDPGSEGTTERITDHMEQCWTKLAAVINTILNRIKTSLDCLPNIILWIVAYVSRFSQTRGFTDTQAKLVVMRFFFNQIINPLLLRPQPLLVDTEIRASAVAVFNLKKVVSILQTIVAIELGEGPMNLAREASQFYEKMDRAPLYDVVDTLLEMTPKDGELTLSDADISLPGIARTSVLITKTDLDSLVMLLNKLKHIDFFSKASQPNGQRQTQRLLDQASLASLLTHVQGYHPDVTNDIAKLSLSEQSVDLHNELHKIFQAFNKPFKGNEEVLVISLGLSTVDCPGMLPEEKVLGMPTPKPKRKASPLPEATNGVDEPSDSESPESSSDEKAPETDSKLEGIERAEDVLASCGFEDSFVDLPSNSQSSFPQNVDPFYDFDSLQVPDQNDPFVSVVSHSVSSESPKLAPPESVPSTNFIPLLIDFGVSNISPALPELPRASSSTTSGPQFDGVFNSSGSNSSGTRFSSSASSGSDGGRTITNKPAQPDELPLSPNKEKSRSRNISRKHSLKANIQNVLSHPLGTSKRERKKREKRTTGFWKGSLSKKNRDRIINTNDVATIIAVAQEKTAKVICDEIIHKYATIKRARSVSSLPDKPIKKEADTSLENTPAVLLDEDEIARDAKHKLRLVLGSSSMPVFPTFLSSSASRIKRNKSGDVLLNHLRKDLADAMVIQDSTMIARLQETLTTLEKLPSSRYPELLKELEEEYRQRKAYVSYLIRAHQGLMATREFLEKMLERVESDREICRRYLMTQCVSMYLDNCKEKLDWFIRKFNRLSMSDEKSEEMKNFLQDLKQEFQRDSLWLGSNEKQKSEAMDAVDRYVIGRVYWNAVYAFGETDKCRDDVFHKNVELMCQSIAEDFRALDIKEEYQREAPWFPAQHELFSLSAYKTPTDKLKCIQRCCTTVMSLLAMANGSGAVGADAFTPVLIYVVMHANPRGLLTTVDFINSYLNVPLTGEQYYCWMQFCSAIQFIKILLEENNSKST